jgi:hypothetical protein
MSKEVSISDKQVVIINYAMTSNQFVDIVIPTGN